MEQRFTLKIADHLASPEGKRRFNEEVFAEIAPRYDFITRALSFMRDAAWKRELVAQLPAQDAPLCLDLACGTGDIAFLLAKKYPAGRVIGIDITEKMLLLARQRNACPNVGFFRQDMIRTGADAGSIDVVTGGYALRNAPDLERAIDEIARVLRPGGVAAFLDFSRPSAPLAGKLQHAVLKAWTSLWGLALHRNPEVYSYIAESLRRYPDRDTLYRLFARKGFTVVQSRLHFFGITQMLVVRKNAETGVPLPCPKMPT
jgi:demethylmenaquinone methyltransferase/2-methoxy-6-polyprenyl-1,4-benzoquinol methylase